MFGYSTNRSRPLDLESTTGMHLLLSGFRIIVLPDLSFVKHIFIFSIASYQLALRFI